MRTIYVTFTIPYFFKKDEKFAVACKDMAQALAVAQDAKTIQGVTTIRLRKCGKPKDRDIISYDTYWNYGEWY